MVNTVGRFGLVLLGVCLLSAAPVFADSTTTFTFIGTLGNIGPTDTFTAGSLSLVATGYSSPGVTTDMWAKNGGLNEMGLGLASEPQHEISGTLFVQLNLTQVLAASPTSIALSIQSIQAGEGYSVWGSNTAGTPGTLLASNQTGATFTLPDLGSFNFISVSGGPGNVLLDDVDVTVPTPEPSAAILLLLGLVALVGTGTLGKKLVV